MLSPYEILLRDCFQASLHEAHYSPLPDEMALQAHWFAGHFGKQFVSEDGQNITLTQPGFWNKSAGPDFLNCGISIDGETRTGDIEIDLTPKHWILHGHGQNVRFNQVILHVCFEEETRKSFTQTQDHSFVPRVIIPPHKIQEVLLLPTHPTLSALPGRCSTPLTNASPERIHTLLQLAARHRMKRKAKLASILEDTHGRQQARWVQLAETLGYKHNTLNFHILAQRLPIQSLCQLEPLEIQSIIYGTAGLLHPDMHTKAEHSSKSWLETMWSTWWQHRQQYECSEERQLKWNLSGTRPVNHPQRRLAALSVLAARWKEFNQLQDIKEIITFLTSLEDPFWNYHYTLLSKTSSRKLALLGKSRVGEFVVNHLIPNKSLQSEEQSWEMYQKIQAPVLSEKVNRASQRLLGKREDTSLFLKKAWQHQAFLQLFQDFCLEHVEGCENCPFPERLKEWADE